MARPNAHLIPPPKSFVLILNGKNVLGGNGEELKHRILCLLLVRDEKYHIRLFSNTWEEREKMGKHRRPESHQAADNLINLFTKCHHDLSRIHMKLDQEFQQIYPDNANPMMLVARIKKLEEDLFPLKDRCRELLAAKQDLIDKARSVLVGNRSMLQRMQTSVGIPVTVSSEDSAYANFNQIIEEWTAEVRSRMGTES
ncbi:hypothetical protein Nepgr_012408 [Nepenthes gracilis]|uniref:Protein FAM33A n=1 Tax=Nepenthes gracilis TaxID=150966 RepID=A0AAD3SG29_NEPGR|nr:hypothetical protein Nepgr_012408 [Nepenthes gracilis]